MKELEHDNHESVGETAFDLPNDRKPSNYNDIRYGYQHVPHPTNQKAKMVNREEIIRQVIEGK